jgi:hypothetical protein
MQLLLPLDSKESADVVDTDQLDGEEQVAKWENTAGRALRSFWNPSPPGFAHLQQNVVSQMEGRYDRQNRCEKAVRKTQNGVSSWDPGVVILNSVQDCTVYLSKMK